MHLSYTKRAALAKAEVSKKLFTLMDQKKTNLALSADVVTASELLRLADELGPFICLLKTHMDMIGDFSFELVEKLRELAKKHCFLICEDRKFADIGNTVKHQYSGGQYRIAEWADLVTVHSLPGPGIIEGLVAGRKSDLQGILLLAQMSSSGHLMDNDYFQKTITMAEQFPGFVAGFITQQGVNPLGNWISMTPGVQLAVKGDALGQNYIPPHTAIFENGTDVIIVGRGILNSPNPATAAELYQRAGWNAYVQRSRVG